MDARENGRMEKKNGEEFIELLAKTKTGKMTELVPLLYAPTKVLRRCVES